MKKYIKYCASLMAVAALSACSDTFMPETEGDGEGRLMLKATVNSDVAVVSRAGETNDELNKSALIWISNSTGAVKKFNGIDEIPPTGIMLLSGNYIAEAWAGDSVSASWDSRYFKGRQEFTITKGSATQVNIECKIANTLVSVKIDDKVATLLNDITLEVGHDKATGTRDGVLTFDSEKITAGAKGYFMTNSRSKNLVYTLRGKLASNGKDFTKTGTLVAADQEVKRATEYCINVKHTDKEEEAIGGAFITIEVDATEVEVEDTYEITSAPSIYGINFDLAAPVSGMIGALPRRSIWIAASTAIKEVIIESETLNSILSATDVEIIGCTDAIKQTLTAAGINYVLNTHADSDFQEIKLNFESAFLNSLAEGDYTFKITVIDDNNRTSTATMRVMPTNAKVMAAPLDPSAMTTTSRKAVLTGTVLRDDASAYGIMYRAKGTQQWTRVASTATGLTSGQSYSVQVSGLSASTVYQFAAYCDGFESTAIEEFTTDPEEQLSNAGMENWCTDNNDNALVPAASIGEMFWDTGNHGSITLGKNITNQDTSIKHSGNSSAKLESQYVAFLGIGKFAAGNIFVGKYLDTDGTDGILGWGRSFTSRPTAMRVWVKYEPATVDRVNKNNVDGVQKGDMDRGIIYIALVDNTKTDYNGQKWPVVVKTKTTELFKKDGKQVIAYGEHVFDSATAGDGLVEVVIPIDYKRTDVRPSNIVVVASASKMGDYFTGGPSKMWVDDFELIYE